MIPDRGMMSHACTFANPLTDRERLCKHAYRIWAWQREAAITRTSLNPGPICEGSRPARECDWNTMCCCAAVVVKMYWCCSQTRSLPMTEGSPFQPHYVMPWPDGSRVCIWWWVGSTLKTSSMTVFILGITCHCNQLIALFLFSSWQAVVQWIMHSQTDYMASSETLE